jgi:hypothetical protein
MSEPRHLPAPPDETAAMRAPLEKPIGCPPLRVDGGVIPSIV